MEGAATQACWNLRSAVGPRALSPPPSQRACDEEMQHGVRAAARAVFETRRPVVRAVPPVTPPSSPDARRRLSPLDDYKFCRLLTEQKCSTSEDIRITLIYIV